MDKDLSSSLGIISPFRAQVSLIKAMVKKALNLDQIKKHHILIGTPYHFQGEERDVIMLSFVIDKNTHPATYNYLNRPDVFNVSITRARSLQLIYTSVSAEQVDTKLLFHEYLSHIEAPRRPKRIP